MADTNQQLLEGQFQTEANRSELEAKEESQDIAQEATEMEEVYYANQLAFQREQEAQATTALAKEGSSFGKASLFKYAIILVIFAIPNDIVDAIELTGFLVILSWLVSLFLSASQIIIMWFADSELKNVREHVGKVKQYQKTAAKTLTKTASRLAKFAPRNPITKVLIGACLEMIPLISIMPWSSICTVLAYMDERKTFKEARASSEELANISQQPVEVV